MDLKVTITDENDVVIETFQIYQDGSDREGASRIKEAVCEILDVEPNMPNIPAGHYPAQY